MTQLSYITRDNSAPTRYNSVHNEKPIVLLSIHPADRYMYFVQLVQNILSAYDCAVYFSENPSDSDTITLKDIKLAVIAVTEKYITWNNSGFRSEALPAIREGTPILPIMMESGIVNLFNTRCGKFQYIDSSSEELANKSQEEIIKHISSFFNSPAAEHNSDYKAKVFISYRKQDIQDLQHLVALINSHPQSDRLHLWYDTNLLPGENYSDTIIDSLKSCDLFLLLVTPAILEQGNYVMRVEYPLAQKEKKVILPVLMKKTDRKKLNECFPSLPKCISDHQIGAIFAKALKQ